jgi:hypothetical protein
MNRSTRRRRIVAEPRRHSEHWEEDRLYLDVRPLELTEADEETPSGTHEIHERKETDEPCDPTLDHR